MEITTVKALESGYLVNESVTVPDDPGNRHYQEVMEWIAQGNTPTPEFTFDEIRANKIADLAAYRYDRETAGIIVNGARIKTDRESQSMINGAKAYSDLNKAVLIDWKGDGGWVTINRTVILAIAQAVAAHVQACFSQEKEHSEAIAALTTVAEIEAYDFTTGWPA